MSSLALPLGSLLDAADGFRSGGGIDPSVRAAAAGSALEDEATLQAILATVAEPVLRVLVEGRRGDVVEAAEAWATEEVTVLAAPLDDGRHEVVVGHTSHLPLQLAAAIDLGPRPRVPVDGPLRLPTEVVLAVLEGAAVETPAGLPAAWGEVLTSWGPSVRQLRVSTGWSHPSLGERWRSVEFVDDPSAGPILVQPADPDTGTEVVLTPTDPTTLLRLVVRLLEIRP